MFLKLALDYLGHDFYHFSVIIRKPPQSCNRTTALQLHPCMLPTGEICHIIALQGRIIGTNISEALIQITVAEVKEKFQVWGKLM